MGVGNRSSLLQKIWSFYIRGRDREIAPTEDRKRSGIGVASYKVIKSRDREIAPTEEGLGIKKSRESGDCVLQKIERGRDREMRPTEDHKEVANREIASYRRVIKSRDREIAPTEEFLSNKRSGSGVAPTNKRSRSGVASYRR